LRRERTEVHRAEAEFADAACGAAESPVLHITNTSHLRRSASLIVRPSLASPRSRCASTAPAAVPARYCSYFACNADRGIRSPSVGTTRADRRPAPTTAQSSHRRSGPRAGRTADGRTCWPVAQQRAWSSVSVDGGIDRVVDEDESSTARRAGRTAGDRRGRGQRRQAADPPRRPRSASTTGPCIHATAGMPRRFVVFSGNVRVGHRAVPGPSKVR
jgi:hypothetical protein